MRQPSEVGESAAVGRQPERDPVVTKHLPRLEVACGTRGRRERKREREVDGDDAKDGNDEADDTRQWRG